MTVTSSGLYFVEFRLQSATKINQENKLKPGKLSKNCFDLVPSFFLDEGLHDLEDRLHVPRLVHKVYCTKPSRKTILKLIHTRDFTVIHYVFTHFSIGRFRRVIANFMGVSSKFPCEKIWIRPRRGCGFFLVEQTSAPSDYITF